MAKKTTEKSAATKSDRYIVMDLQENKYDVYATRGDLNTFLVNVADQVVEGDLDGGVDEDALNERYVVFRGRQLRLEMSVDVDVRELRP